MSRLNNLQLVDRPARPAPKRRVVAAGVSRDVIGQVRTAWRSPAALSVGAAMGGFVPVATFTLAHDGGLTPLLWVILGAGSAFSLVKVIGVAEQVFRSRAQGTMFAVLLEGVALAAPQLWLARGALGFLVLINAVALGCGLALRQKEQ